MEGVVDFSDDYNSIVTLYKKEFKEINEKRAELDTLTLELLNKMMEDVTDDDSIPTALWDYSKDGKMSISQMLHVPSEKIQHYIKYAQLISKFPVLKCIPMRTWEAHYEDILTVSKIDNGSLLELFPVDPRK